MHLYLGKLRNTGTGDIIDVHSTTDSPDSSYGLACWVDGTGHSYGQIQFGAPIGFDLFDVTTVSTPEEKEE